MVSVKHRLQRSQKKREGGAKLVADIRKEAAFHLVEFEQLLVAFLEHFWLWSN